jgi:YebC/PmpR family DNA-binding regulatory protein
MSGHSKWSTIKRRKGAVDAKRGKIFTQLIRELTMAARLGGGNVDSNPRLRLAMEKARAQNMPKDNIERAVKKGTGELEGESYEEVRYEGYGPSGVAVIVDTLTDNRNRTVGDVRHLFGKYGGNLGASGCVAYLFDKRGLLVYDAEGLDGEALMERAIEANALDVNEDRDTIEVQTEPDDFEAVKQALERLDFVAHSAEIALVPQTSVKLAGKEAQTMLRLFEALDEHEDVKQVCANFDIAENELVEAAKAG